MSRMMRTSVIATEPPAIDIHPEKADAPAEESHPSPRRAAGSGFLDREQILRATHACFTGFGYDGTTIRAIAGRLNCSVGSIYRYFADKRELLLACAAAVFEPLLHQTRQRQISADESFGRYVHTAAEHDELYRLLFWLSAAGDDSATPDVVRKLIDAWSPAMNDAPMRWATAHGLLMLGTDPAQIARQFPHSSAPLPAAPPEAAAPVEVDEEDVDVTLL